MRERARFVALATVPGANIRALCQTFGISPTTGYLWLRRGASGELADRSQRPHSAPRQLADAQAALVLALRSQQPTWGGRKLRAALLRQGLPAPAASTCTAVLRRAGLLAPPLRTPPPLWKRFVAPQPTICWQMDFTQSRRGRRAGAAADRPR